MNVVETFRKSMRGRKNGKWAVATNSGLESQRMHARLGARVWDQWGRGKYVLDVDGSIVVRSSFAGTYELHESEI